MPDLPLETISRTGDLGSESRTRFRISSLFAAAGAGFSITPVHIISRQPRDLLQRALSTPHRTARFRVPLSAPPPRGALCQRQIHLRVFQPTAMRLFSRTA